MKKLIPTLVFILSVIFISCGGRYLGPNDVCEYRGELCDHGHYPYYYCYTKDSPYGTYWYDVQVNGEYETWSHWGKMYNYYCE